MPQRTMIPTIINWTIRFCLFVLVRHDSELVILGFSPSVNIKKGVKQEDVVQQSCFVFH